MALLQLIGDDVDFMMVITDNTRSNNNTYNKI